MTFVFVKSAEIAPESRGLVCNSPPRRPTMSERMGKYWVCDLCAVRRGWKPFKTAYTVCEGLCSWCDTKTTRMLTPLRDLKNKDGIRADCEKTPEADDER